MEWTEADHLRHTKFVGVREGKDPHKVVREPDMEQESKTWHIWIRG
jgi:hypothetical protein